MDQGSIRHSNAAIGPGRGIVAVPGRSAVVVGAAAQQNVAGTRRRNRDRRCEGNRVTREEADAAITTCGDDVGVDRQIVGNQITFCCEDDVSTGIIDDV